MKEEILYYSVQKTAEKNCACSNEQSRLLCSERDRDVCVVHYSYPSPVV